MTKKAPFTAAVRPEHDKDILTTVVFFPECFDVSDTEAMKKHAFFYFFNKCRRRDQFEVKIVKIWEELAVEVK